MCIEVTTSHLEVTVGHLGDHRNSEFGRLRHPRLSCLRFFDLPIVLQTAGKQLKTCSVWIELSELRPGLFKFRAPPMRDPPVWSFFGHDKHEGWPSKMATFSGFWHESSPSGGPFFGHLA